MKKDFSYMSRGFNAKSAQGGFIQNLIIPGIILIGLVIAGIAMLSSGSSTNTDNEKASMLANVFLSQGMTMATAIQRAEADGAIPPSASVGVNLTTSLVTPNYLSSLPVAPADAGGGSWVYNKMHVVAAAGGSTAGTAAADDFVRVPLGTALAEAVCLRINNKLFGTSTLVGTAPGTDDLSATIAGVTGAPVGAIEGCMKDSNNSNAYTYYKLINVR